MKAIVSNDPTKCLDCEEGYVYEKIVRIIDSQCYKCGGKMRIALGRNGYITYGPIDFTPLEIEIAIKRGVVLNENYSKTREEKYLSNTCSKCGSFVGERFLSDYLFESDLGHVNYLDERTGITSCDYCSQYSDQDY